MFLENKWFPLGGGHWEEAVSSGEGPPKVLVGSGPVYGLCASFTVNIFHSCFYIFDGPGCENILYAMSMS